MGRSPSALVRHLLSGKGVQQHIASLDIIAFANCTETSFTSDKKDSLAEFTTAALQLDQQYAKRAARTKPVPRGPRLCEGEEWDIYRTDVRRLFKGLNDVLRTST